MSSDLEDNIPAMRPRIWYCSWFRCAQAFCQRSELAEHIEQVHFKHILAVKTQYWDDYLRASQGWSGTSDRWKANVPSQPVKQTQEMAQDSPRHHPTPHSTTSPSTPPKPRAPIPRSVPRPCSSSQRSPTAFPPITTPSESSPKCPLVAFKVTPEPGPSSQSPASIASLSFHSRSLKRRRTASFASCAAQSSPMSTPSVSSMPPSPALSNMITDAINAAGRINAGTLSPSPEKATAARRSKPLAPSPLSNGTGSSASGRPVVPIPRRTNLGASPTPSGPRSLVDVLNSNPNSPTTVLRASSSFHSPGFGKGAAYLHSPAAASVASAQAVEDALTQLRSPNLQISSARSQSNSQSTSHVRNLQLLSQSGSWIDESQSASSSDVKQHPHPSQLSAEPGSYCGSHAVESEHSQFVPRGQSVGSTTEASVVPSSSQPVKPIAPIPRTNRSKITALSQPQSQTQHQHQSPPPPVAAAPIPRILRSRSKTPAPASALPSQSQRVPILRRTIRSRASSAVPSANADTQTRGNGIQKRPSSKPPSAGPERRSSRARSKPLSVGSTGAGVIEEGRVASGGLPAVDEHPDDETSRAASGPDTAANHGHESAHVPATSGQSQGGAGFRSGKLHVPVPRRTRAHSRSQSQSNIAPTPPQLPSQVQSQSRNPVKEELDPALPMDVDSSSLSRPQPETHLKKATNGDGAADSSQGSGKGYVEGYGFDMGSIVLQTQAPYKWSQTPSP
ncbi:hypothetical protein BC628DRAFT_1368243 [Trametes gibbosa]|nr:hypothetical protein BC628DRAFT_1368243 [Trametes gibbosa]